MKKSSVFICVNLWFILLSLPLSAQDFRTVRDGVEYSEMTRVIEGKPVKMNLLRLDLTKVRLDVVHGMDTAVGVEKVSSMAGRYGAVAAINAGFFRFDGSLFAGDPAGVLKIDGKLWSESQAERITLLISNEKNETRVKFAHLEVNYGLSFGKNGILEVDGINRERKPDELIIYTPEFQRTTLTNSNGAECLVSKKKVTKLVRGGSNVIPANGLIISADGSKVRELEGYCRKDARVATLTKFPVVSYDDENEEGAEAEKRKFLSESGENDYQNAEDIVGGIPQLIRDGRIEITWQEERTSKAFVETRHPRTAVAKLRDGKFLMVTVDGRSEESGGIGLQNLAEILLELGATDAMNLDGGGSTTMFLGGKVVNKPSDKEGERRVSDAILVFPRRKQTGL